MFDDFDRSATVVHARKRFRSSMIVAAVVYGTSSAAIVAATNVVVKRVEQDDPVIVWRPPPPEADTPPDPRPAPAATQERKKPPFKRPTPTPTPKQLPQTKPRESDAPLADLDGESADGVEGGLGSGIGIGTVAVQPRPEPPPRPEPLLRPVEIRSDARPRYPLAARRKGIEGVVVVAFDVLEDGRVANVRIVSGPEELRASVLEAASHWRFKPARRGGKPVRYHMTKTVLFRLEDA